MTHEEKTRKASDGRIDWVDYARGIGIFLVVLGHTERGLLNSDILPRTPGWEYLDAWIYAFHMPLFFFLAGLFFTPSVRRGAHRFLTDKLRTIAYPYLVWSVLQELLQLGMSRYTNNPASWSSLAEVAYLPPMQFWFLYSLFLAYLLFLGLYMAGIRSWGLLVVALAIFAIEMEYGLGPWLVLRQTAWHLPYLALGIVAADARMTGERASFLLAGMLMFLGFGGVSVLAVWGPVEGWLRLPAAVSGIAGTVGLCWLLARLGGPTFIKTWGVLSLQIYVAHTIASAGLRIVLQKFAGITDPVIHFMGGMIIGLYGPIALNGLAEWVGFRWLFTAPKSRSKVVAKPDVDQSGKNLMVLTEDRPDERETPESSRNN